MAKKQRRKQQPQRIQVPSAAPVAGASSVGTAPSSAPARTVPAAGVPTRRRPETTWAEFSERYRYVNAELKQLGILAGSFLVVLLVLAAVLR